MNMRTSGFARSTLTITFLVAIVGAINSVVCLTQAPQAGVAQQKKCVEPSANPKLTALIQRQKKSEQAAFDEFVHRAHMGCSVGSSGFGKMLLGAVGSYVGVHPSEAEFAAPFFAPENEKLRSRAIEKVAADKQNAQRVARLVEAYAKNPDHSIGGLRTILHQANCASMGLDSAHTTVDELVEQLKKQGDTPNEMYFDNLAQALYVMHLFFASNKLDDLISQVFSVNSSTRK